MFKKKKKEISIVMREREAFVYEVSDINSPKKTSEETRHPKKIMEIKEYTTDKKTGEISITLVKPKTDREKFIESIAHALQDKVNVKEFLKDKLKDYDETDLKDFAERLSAKKPKVRQRDGCYELLIGGKKGRPLVLSLSD